jgi:hypothetical protein
MVFLNKLTDLPANQVAGVKHGQVVVEPCRLQRSRAFDRPDLPPDCAGKYGTRPFLCPVAKCDYVVKSFAELWISHFGPRR